MYIHVPLTKIYVNANHFDLLQVYMALMISAIGIATASGISLDKNKTTALANSAYEMLNTKPQIDSSSSKGSRFTTLVGDIELKNVSFTYPSRPNVQILKELCLRVPAGKVVKKFPLLFFFFHIIRILN